MKSLPKLVNEIINGWEDRETYHVDRKQLEMLIDAGAEVVYLNKGRTDANQIFQHEVTVGDKTFIGGTTEKI